MPKLEAKSDIPVNLKPYLFHGLELHRNGPEAIGEWPWCGSEKFSVNIEKGIWKCWVCNEGANEKGGGNIYTFLSHLYKLSHEKTTESDYQELQISRGFIEIDSMMIWGLAKSIITNEWILPVYGTDQKIKGMYIYREIGNKKRMMGTAGMKITTPLGAGDFSHSKPNLIIVEGIWDAIALYEVLSSGKIKDGKFVSSSKKTCELATTNLIAVPGCNIFPETWKYYAKGKNVTILFDNDYPRKNKKTGKEIPPPAYSGIRKITNTIGDSAAGVEYLNWGEEDYHDTNTAEGTDLRDLFKGKSIEERRNVYMAKVYNNLHYIEPDESISSSSSNLIPCSSYRDLKIQWRKAMRWTEGLDRGLAVMLASIASTKLLGDQLWVKIIGPPACGKSTLCEAVSSATEYVVAKSTIRGFHSGYGDGTEDHSLVNKIKDKTLVIKDGDTLLQAPNLGQILSEARDLYDTVSRTYYRNKASRDYTGIRMTWILCGTSSLRALDSSELGARFLDCVIMDKIDSELEDEIAMSVAYKAERNLSLNSDENKETQQDETMTKAIKMTGGYVEYLRNNANDLMQKTTTPDWAIRRCARLGKFIAFARARPSITQNETAEREFATRLTSQFIRLAKCLTIVMNKKLVDHEIIEMVQKVALDTGRGVVLELLKRLHEEAKEGDYGGLEVRALAMYLAISPAEASKLLRFLKKIDCVEQFRKVKNGVKGVIVWRMTKPMSELYEEILGGLPNGENEKET